MPAAIVRMGERPSPTTPTRDVMRKLFTLVGGTLGSYAGWALGATVGTMTAFMVSMVGTGVGIYAGLRLARRYVD